ncbi:hypothetical protein WJX73_004123 [Symbiochloris irregularis]|uniref:Bacterial surface antigen (D15) domain-containing protein n=1 Tax=Symbiochloris irregularis TaxID=706552 RepID=A0AAW1NSZ3_9CHLO
MFQQATQAVQSAGDGLTTPFRGRSVGQHGLSVTGDSKARKLIKRKGVDAKPEPTFNCTGVSVEGVDGQLKGLVTDILSLQPNKQYSVSDVEREVSKVFSTGFFSSARPKVTKDHGRENFEITIQVEPNPVLKGVTAAGADALPARFIHDLFAPQFGSIVNFGLFGQSLKRLNYWYQERGVFGQVTNVHMNENNVAEIRLIEIPVNEVRLVFRDKKTGKPVSSSKIAPEAIERHITLQSGKPFNVQQAQADMLELNGTGLFQEVDILPRPAEGFTDEAPALDVLVSLVEKDQVAMSGGGGFKQGEGLGGIFGMASFSHRNLFGQGQRFQGSAEIGPEERTVSLSYSDPWVFNNKRRGGELVTEDSLGCPLTWSGTASDHCLRASVETALLRPSTQALVKLEQDLPIRPEWPVSSRISMRAAQALPLGLFNSLGIASVQGGAVYGDLPPYDATPLGGANSVRGYQEGGVGTARNFVIASGELRLPVPVREGGVQAVAFTDWASDLGSGASVKGDPARHRGKPGKGYGCGVGLRIDSPIGVLRLEWAVNDRGKKGPYFVVGSPSLL